MVKRFKLVYLLLNVCCLFYSSSLPYLPLSTIILYIFLLVAVAEYRKPIIKKPLEDTQSQKDVNLVLSVVFTADPLPDIVWLKDGVEIKSDENMKMKLETKELDYGLKEFTATLTFPSSRSHSPKDWGGKFHMMNL